MTEGGGKRRRKKEEEEQREELIRGRRRRGAFVNKKESQRGRSNIAPRERRQETNKVKEDKACGFIKNMG